MLNARVEQVKVWWDTALETTTTVSGVVCALSALCWIALTLLPGSTSHILQLEQIRWEEAANYNTMSNFTVKITRNGGTVRYTGCEWTAVEEESRSPLVWQRATLAARQRTEEQNGAAG